MANRREQDEDLDQPQAGVPGFVDAGEPLGERGAELSEGGRVVDIESTPEGSLMRMGTVTTSEPAPLPADMERDAAFEEIDNRAADDARMSVRRREHSAD